MKKVLVLIVVLVAISFPLSAKTNLLNFGYGVHGDYWGIDQFRARSIGVDYIRMGGEAHGFYSQLNPYFTTSVKFPDGSTMKLSDSTESIFGMNTILGYGGDINFGQMGIILGGGVFVDFNYFNESVSAAYLFSISSGLGIGGNLIAPFLFVPAAILGFSLIIIPFVLAVVKNEFVKKELEYIFLLPIVGSSFGLGILLYHIFANFVVVTCGNYEFTSIGYFAFAFFGTILLFNSIFLNKKVRVKFFSEI